MQTQVEWHNLCHLFLCAQVQSISLGRLRITKAVFWPLCKTRTFALKLRIKSKLKLSSVEALWHLPLKMPHVLVFSPSFPSFVFMAVAFLSKKRSHNDPDPRAVFSAGWCGSPSARVPDTVGRSSTSATRVGIAPTSCTPGAGHTSEALVQCL